jgi:CRISPR/Cas system-associated protein Csx1
MKSNISNSQNSCLRYPEAPPMILDESKPCKIMVPSAWHFMKDKYSRIDGFYSYSILLHFQAMFYPVLSSQSLQNLEEWVLDFCL